MLDLKLQLCRAWMTLLRPLKKAGRRGHGRRSSWVVDSSERMGLAILQPTILASSGPLASAQAQGCPANPREWRPKGLRLSLPTETPKPPFDWIRPLKIAQSEVFRRAYNATKKGLDSGRVKGTKMDYFSWRIREESNEDISWVGNSSRVCTAFVVYSAELCSFLALFLDD